MENGPPGDVSETAGPRSGPPPTQPAAGARRRNCRRRCRSGTPWRREREREARRSASSRRKAGPQSSLSDSPAGVAMAKKAGLRLLVASLLLGACGRSSDGTSAQRAAIDRALERVRSAVARGLGFDYDTLRQELLKDS